MLVLLMYLDHLWLFPLVLLGTPPADGIHLREICKDTNLAMGDTQHHLSVLENGRIKSKRIGQYKRKHYYPMSINEQHELILAFLRQDTARDVLIYLIEHSGSTQSDIAHFKNFWHMSRLIEAGIVIFHRECKTVQYFIKDPESLIDSLRNYFPTIWNNLSDRFAKLFIQISPGRKKST